MAAAARPAPAGNERLLEQGQSNASRASGLVDIQMSPFWTTLQDKTLHDET